MAAPAVARAVFEVFKSWSPTAAGKGHRRPFDVAVVTSAALPWRTGPSFFSLWHACGLADLGLRVAYVIPWLRPASQERAWGSVRFTTPDEQYAWIAAEALRIGCPGRPEFFCYSSWFAPVIRGVVPLEDVFGATPAASAYMLEEPEHLCWYPLTRSRRRIAADRVVGLVMTNYEYYVGHAKFPGASLLATLVARYHRYLIRTRTDVAVPLSAVVPMTGISVRDARITGVLPAYADVPPVTPTISGVYFIGKTIWEKGLDTLIDIACRTGQQVDVFGDGPDSEAVRTTARERGAPLRFHGASDSPWTMLSDYRVFLNPSQSETICTTTAEALVAGRHVVLPACPGNDPFLKYPNAHFYRDVDGAVAALRRALAELPVPPTEARQDFDWPTACRTLAGICGVLPAGAAIGRPSFTESAADG